MSSDETHLSKNTIKKLNKILKIYWRGRIDGFEGLYPEQQECIKDILKGNDVLKIMPTGKGKSVCFQLPALYYHFEPKKQYITIVITPTTALVDEQVKKINAAAAECGLSDVAVGITKKSLNSSFFNLKTTRENCDRIIRGEIGIIYVLPSILYSTVFLHLTRYIKDRIRFIAVDEAHCVSCWGHNFQPEYLMINDFVRSLLKRPVIAAFTATASRYVAKDIVKILGLRHQEQQLQEVVPKEEFVRNDLKLRMIICREYHDKKSGRIVTEDEQREWKINEIVKSKIRNNEQGIIYSYSISGVDEIAGYLEAKGISCARYYGSMSSREKSDNLDKFAEKDVYIMVATTAYGMGIDKEDISFIINYNMPLSIEDYYQEVGRAARGKGLTAECFLFYKDEDEEGQRGMIWHGVEDPIFKKLAQERYDAMLGLVKDNGVSCTGSNGTEEKDKISEHIHDQIYKYFSDPVSHPQKLGLEKSDRISLLYVNRTYVAGEIRKGRMAAGLDGSKPLQVCGNKKNGNDINISYKVDQRLDYLDMVIADAVYSLWLMGKPIYIKSIFSILSGGREPSIKSIKRDEIENRLDRLMNTKIVIISNRKESYGIELDDESKKCLEERGIAGIDENGHKEYSGIFLPMKMKVFSNKRHLTEYQMDHIPPLYYYAEVLNQFYIFSGELRLEDDKSTFPMSMENIVIKHYLLTRIANLPMVHNKMWMSNKICFYDKKYGDNEFLGARLGICSKRSDNKDDRHYAFEVDRKQKTIIEKILKMLNIYMNKGMIYKYYKIYDNGMKSDSNYCEKGERCIAVSLEAFTEEQKTGHVFRSNR